MAETKQPDPFIVKESSQTQLDQGRIMKILNNEGIVVKLSISAWRGTAKLDPEDLGLKDDVIGALRGTKRISLGRKRLVVDEEFNDIIAIERKANSFLEDNSAPYIGNAGRFVPNIKVAAVIKKMKEFETEYMTRVARFLNKYDEIKLKSMNGWHDFLRNELITPELVPNETEREGAIEKALGSIRESFPTRDQLNRRFSFSWVPFQIRVPENLDASVGDTTTFGAVAEARAQVQREAATQMREQANDFIKSYVDTLRQQTKDLLDSIAKSIKDSKVGIHQKTLNRLKDEVAFIRSMNWTDDKSLENILKQTENRIDVKAKEVREAADPDGEKARIVAVLDQIREDTDRMIAEGEEEAVDSFLSQGNRKLLNNVFKVPGGESSNGA